MIVAAYHFAVNLLPTSDDCRPTIRKPFFAELLRQMPSEHAVNVAKGQLRFDY